MNFFWLASCTEFLNERKEKPQTIELSNARFSCLKSLPEMMSLYLEGRVEAADIRSGFDCGKNALMYFNAKTRGSLSEGYTLEDMRNFFGKYFLKKNNVTPEFAAELFKLKKVILGGSEKALTKAEIQKMISLLELLKEQAVLLSPHFPVLVGHKLNATWTDVNAATEQLRATAWIVLREVDLVNSDYTFENLKKFFEGLNSFVNSAKPLYLYEKINQNIPLFEAAKSVIIGDDSRFDSMSDWQDGLRTLLEIYRESLRYHYFIRDNKFKAAKDLDTLIAFLDDAFQIVEESLPMKRHGIIPFVAIDRLLQTLEKGKNIPLGLSADSLKDIYKRVVLRLLDPRRQGNPRGLVGFEKVHLAALRQEWKIYRLHQYFINNLNLDPQKSLAQKDLRKAFKDFNSRGYTQNILSSNSLEQKDILDAWQWSSEFLFNAWPVLFDEQGRVLIVPQPGQVRQTWSSLTEWNLVRALARAMMLGYGPGELTRADLELWYEDFLKLGIELKAFDPRNGNTGARSFKEANFFTFSGNGDLAMNGYETFEFISAMIAGGMNSANAIRLDMLQRGCDLTQVDVFGYPWLDEKCFKQNLRDQAARYFANMPGLVQHISQMNQLQWDEFYLNLMSSARVSPEDGNRVETSDLRTAVMMLHYAETLVIVYDQDHSGALNGAEVKLAAPRFLQFMKDLSPIKANFVVSDFFLFLVFKGKIPTTGDYILFQGEKVLGLGEISRDKILRVFKVLKDEAAK